MLSLQFIRENPDLVRKAVRDRNTDAPIDRILELDSLRREYIQQADDLKAQRNNLGREVARAAPDERQALLDRGKSLSAAIDTFDEKLRAVEPELNALLFEVPNIPATDVPVGKDEESNVVVRIEGTPREYNFEPLPHWDLGERL